MGFLQPISQEAITSGDYSPDQISRMDPNVLAGMGLTRFGQPMPAGGPAGQFGSLFSSLSSASPRIAAPDISKFQYSQDALNAPTYMRQLGEANAQQAFQNQARYGAQLGNSVQGYQKALTDRNNARLSYMNQAGQAQMGVEGQQRSAQENYQDQLAKIFGLNVTQRGQEMDYLGSFNKGGGGGSSWSSVLGGGKSSGGGGGFIGMGSNPGQGVNRGPYIGMDTHTF